MKRLFYCVLAMMLVCVPAFGQTFKVIHSFSGYPNDGSAAISNVVFDQAGNLYGTTPGGGSGFVCGDNGCGIAYELSPNKDGSWTETVIYNFCSVISGNACQDGAYPDAGLALDSSGNLYGTTSEGGRNCSPLGCGTVFQLSPPQRAGGAWTHTILYDFCNMDKGGQCLDGEVPSSQLVFDSTGNLYGTTGAGGSGHGQIGGGPVGGGTVFKLSPGVDGWTESVIYDFCSRGQGDSCPDGLIPNGGVTFSSSGDLYGTTDYSGEAALGDGGTVYRLSPQNGGWRYTLLLDVPQSSKSSILQGPIAFDGHGNIYSTFSAPYGGVFQMNLTTHKLNMFSFNGNDGLDPIGGVYVDSRAGALYGTTSGSAKGPGNIFRIGKNGKETVLHNFCSSNDCTDGQIPWSTLVPDKSGYLYGTTEFSGDYGGGVVFEITP